MKKNTTRISPLSKKALGAAAALLLSASLLTACQSQPAASTADYIGIDAAKDAALKAAGVSADQAAFSSAGLDSRDGIFYYQVIFTENGVEREYDIDAVTGVVIEEKVLTPASEAESTAAQTDSAAAPASGPAAQAGTAAPDAQTQSALSGTPASENPSAAAPSGSSAAASAVNEDSALSIALEHAGVTREQLVHSRVKPDRDDGLMIFEVEFITTDGMEYDYDISQADGTILSFNQEAHVPYNPAAGTEGLISEDQARQAVIDRVPGASAENVAVFLDEDDGRLEYEGHLAYDNMLYEFTIDAYSGAVIEWEAEIQRLHR